MELLTQSRQLSDVTELSSSFLLNQQAKIFTDNIHGHVRVHATVLKLVHTQEFQRLHNIKQLGFCYMVYETAKHSRFEHSIGVYWLAYRLLCNIVRKYPDKEYYIHELGIKTKLTEEIAVYILISSILHDIFHGPFSHTFDHIALQNSKSKNATHEVRSIEGMRTLCKRELNYPENVLNFIASLIKPTKPEHSGVLYQIVCNELNGLDVDKLDYLQRDSVNVGLGTSPKIQVDRILEEFIIDKNNNIAYSKHCSQSILSIFTTRYTLHSTVYQHKTVKIVEVMYSEILELIDPIFKISESVDDMKKFIRYTDEKIFQDLSTEYDEGIDEYEYKKKNLSKVGTIQEVNQRINRAYQIYQNILTRKLYKAIFYGNDLEMKDVKCFADHYPEGTFKILTIENGFVSHGRPDPFLTIFFYDDPNEETFTLNKTSIAGIYNSQYKEIKILLICRDREKAPKIKEHWKGYYKNLKGDIDLDRVFGAFEKSSIF